MSRRTTLLTVISALLFSLSLATAASAQGRDPWWGRNDDRRRDRDDGYYGQDDGYYRRGRYDERQVRDLAERIKDRSRRLESSVDSFLDRSRVNGTRREDHVNDDVREFRRAADRFRERVGNGRDLNRSANEARQLVASANHVDRMLSRLRVDSRVYADWREIERDLSYVADIYGINYRGGNDDYRRGGYDPRYPNDYPDDRNRRSGDNWWRRIPEVINGRRP
jgi:hypothetical protein